MESQYAIVTNISIFEVESGLALSKSWRVMKGILKLNSQIVPEELRIFFG
jgi:hypothetical protein